MFLDAFVFDSFCGGVFCLNFGSIVTESLLNILGKFSEINFRYSRFGNEHNAIGLDSAHLGVFVFFSVNRFEVSGEGA